MITIKPENAAQIDAFIAAAEGRATSRTLDHADAEYAVKVAEKRLAALPQRLWKGATVTYQPHVVPNAYGHKAMSTEITLLRTATRWALIAAKRVATPTARYGQRGEASDTRVTLARTSAVELAEGFAHAAHLGLLAWPTTDEAVAA